ncbi:MAG: MotA/TolQ/ExbB proton channel family protein [Candidatus Latescibacteria bacterium]|nr:MotA/TolQ/ExbB proton channel family protein [Candidatus Latescibacterota bacterium]NIO55402.1 MotA/TolQ/ExbB proton channel family protein [Candidatus Latescibacterota bacterium]
MKQGTFNTIVLLVAFLISCGVVFGWIPAIDKEDPTTGRPQNPILHQIKQAGPLVAVLLTLLLMVFAYVVERMLTLRKARGKRRIQLFVAEFGKAIHQNRLDEASKLCDNQRGSAAAVLKAGVDQYQRLSTVEDLSPEKRLTETQRAINEARLLEVPFLERNLIALSTIASIATMVGLLGTTIGMIRAFAAMARQGAPDAIQLAMGISEALVNTAGGLLAAILGIVAYNVLVNWVDQFNYNIDEASYVMIELLKEKEG